MEGAHGFKLIFDRYVRIQAQGVLNACNLEKAAFRVWGFRVQGLGLRVQAFGFRASGLGFGL